jgi:hypothetical protein
MRIATIASVSLCVRMKDYSTPMQSLNSSGNVENMSVQRQDRTGAQIDEANAPAEYLHPGLQPGQHRFAGERLVRHTATHIGAKRRRDHVEFAYDWRRDRVSRAVDYCISWRDLDHETNQTSTSLGGSCSPSAMLTQAPKAHLFAMAF